MFNSMCSCKCHVHLNDFQYGIIWNDKKIKIDWPIENPILSEKDSKLPQLNLVKL